MATRRIAIRRATLLDRDEVLAINLHVFEGMDYLPSLYTVLLQDKDFWSYVAIVDGKLASFSAYYLDHIGKNFAGVTSRTNPEFLGLRLTSLIEQHAFGEMKEKLPEEYQEYWVAADKPHVFTSKFWSNPYCRLIRRNVFLTYILPKEVIQKAANRGMADPRVQAVSVKRLGHDESLEVMMDTNTRRYILKDEVVLAFNNCLPLAFHRRNLKRIVTQCVMFASYKSDDLTVSAVSLSSMVPAPCGVIANIDIYGTEHVDTTLSHLIHHLDHCASTINDNEIVGFRIQFPAESDKEVIKDFLLQDFGKARQTKAYPLEYSIIVSEANTFLSRL